MPDAVSIDVTQAAQWWLRDDERLIYNWADYHCVVPPYPETWMEFIYPKQLRANGGIKDTPASLQNAGVLLITREIDSVTAETVRGKHYPFLSIAMNRYLPSAAALSPLNEMPEDSDTCPRWLVIGLTFLANRDMPALTNLWATTLDLNGRYIRHVAIPMLPGIIAILNGTTVERARAIIQSLSQDQQAQMFLAAKDDFEQPFFFCLSLLHCRNVEIVDKPAPPAPILKQRAKKGIPYIQYKTLEVKPLRKVTQGGKRNSGEAEPKALHFVRGHFKDFTAKGLFGKYKGVYWWDSVVRGDVSKGIIDKDYKVSHD